MNQFLLHSNHRNISATHVIIFMVMRTRIQIQTWRVENIFNFLLYFTLIDNLLLKS